jgi:hypothetical protein
MDRDGMYFCSMKSNVIDKNINNSGYMYVQYESLPCRKLFATVKPDQQFHGPLHNASLILSILANSYDIFLTPEVELNGKVMMELSQLMKQNGVVFKDAQQKKIRINDIIFNVAVSLNSKLKDDSNQPRFIISITNYFDDGRIKSPEIQRPNYEKTKQYTEQLLVYLYKKFTKLKFRDDKGFTKEPQHACKITDWMWVRQGNIQDQDREKYGDANTNYAFLKPDITAKQENYAIDGKVIVERAKKELVKDFKLHELNLHQNFERWHGLITTNLNGWIPYKKDDVMFFHKPKSINEIKFENFKYIQYKNVFSNQIFTDIVFKSEFKQNELSPEQKNNIFTVLSNCYQIYLMPTLKNKELVLNLLINLIRDNPEIYLDKKEQKILFNDIVFNISANLDLDKYTAKPAFVLLINNAINSDKIKIIDSLLQKQQIAITKERTEKMLIFLKQFFEKNKCLDFSDVKPVSSVHIKDLFFVSQVLPWNALNDKNAIFDASNNFAYFKSNVTGEYIDYIIKPAELFPEKNQPLHPIAQQVINNIRQSIPGSNDENKNYWSSLWTWIQWFFSLLVRSLRY